MSFFVGGLVFLWFLPKPSARGIPPGGIEDGLPLFRRVNFPSKRQSTIAALYFPKRGDPSLDREGFLCLPRKKPGRWSFPSCQVGGSPSLPLPNHFFVFL